VFIPQTTDNVPMVLQLYTKPTNISVIRTAIARTSRTINGANETTPCFIHSIIGLNSGNAVGLVFNMTKSISGSPATMNNVLITLIKIA